VSGPPAPPALVADVAGVADRELVVGRALESGASAADGQPLGVAGAAALFPRRGRTADP